MPNIYLALWEWAFDGEEYRWQPPGGNFVGCLDLRGYRQKAPRGGTPGRGLFVFPEARTLGDEAINLGTDVQGQVGVAARDGIRIKLGLDAALVSTSVADIISELRQVHGDPTGIDRWMPQRGSSRGGTKQYLGGFGMIKTEAMDATILASTIAVFRANFRRHVVNGIDTTTLRKFTGAEMLKLWRTMSDEYADVLMPPEYRFIGWQEPTTTLVDNFNRGDSSPGWGTASGGFSWGEITGNMDIVSNTGQSPTGSTENFSRAETDLSSDEHYSEFTTAVISGTTSAGFGCAVRCSSSAATYARGVVNNVASGATRYIYTVTTDTPTIIASGGATSDPTDGVTKVMVDSADLITLLFDAGTELTVTDAHGGGNLRVGASKRASSMVCSWDNFTGADLAAPAVDHRHLLLMGVG